MPSANAVKPRPGAAQCTCRRAATVTPGDPVLASLAAEPADDFLAGVARIHDWLRAGDVFQVNLSRRWSGTLADGVDPAHLHLALRAASPGAVCRQLARRRLVGGQFIARAADQHSR